MHYRNTTSRNSNKPTGYIVGNNMCVPISSQIPIQTQNNTQYLVQTLNDASVAVDTLQRSYVLVQCIDPQHGRKLVSETGLLTELIGVLRHF